MLRVSSSRDKSVANVKLETCNVKLFVPNLKHETCNLKLIFRNL